jgi:hypothetical protein
MRKAGRGGGGGGATETARCAKESALRLTAAEKRQRPDHRGVCQHCETFYRQNIRQSGQYPEAANATPATAKSAAPPMSALFMLLSPSKARESV